MTDARNIVENTLVPHKAFEDATDRLKQCFKNSANASEPICIALVGESRTGKSRALEECSDRYPETRDEEGLNVPILRVKTPSKPTVKSLAELMLRAMRDPLCDRGTENTKTSRLQTLMRNCETRMVMIDEFQHFVDKGSHKVMHHVADWLKILVDDAGVALVVAGLPRCLAVLEQNEQLAGRFLAPVLMPRFDWFCNDHGKSSWRSWVRSMKRSATTSTCPPLMGTRWHSAAIAARGGSSAISPNSSARRSGMRWTRRRKPSSLSDLAKAHKEAVWADTESLKLPNPFAKGFTAQFDADLVTRVQQIGRAIEPPPPARGQQRRAGGPGPTANQVLRAS